MALACHGAIQRAKSDADLTIALAGNPNVGKSSVFNYLTGLDATTANYPGKTVEVGLGTTTVEGSTVALVDLPGTYALGAVSDDQWAARRAILDSRPDAVLAVVDATNLARNLYLVLQLLDLGLSVVVALNLVDEAERRGVTIDAERLSASLGVPVIPTVATSGTGLRDALTAAVAVARRQCCHPTPQYGADVDEAIVAVSARIEELRAREPLDGLSSRALAIFLLEEDSEVANATIGRSWGREALTSARTASLRLADALGEAGPILLPRRRHALASRIAHEVSVARQQATTDRFLSLTTSFVTGLPVLLAVLAGTFAFLFFVGNWLATAFSDLWETHVSPLIQGAFLFLFGDGTLANTLLWGFDAGIQAALGVGIPYILTFYFLLALLEDSGYLSSAAFLADQLMRRLGLHGRAIIPLVAGAGCNVPAIIGTRVLSTLRERVIASTLIVLVPCSARTAVILGAVSLYLGWQPALAAFAMLAIIVTAVGLLLNRIMPGQTGGLMIEMFPFRRPHLATTARKTWSRFREFVFVAMPIVLVGSLILGALYETGYVWVLADPMAPIVQGWLGLPAVAGLTLLFAVLRKELALQLLVTLAIAQYGTGASDLLTFLTPRQVFVYAIVNAIYIPCIATVAVLGRELGWRRALGIMTFTVALAVAIGGATDRVIAALGLL